MATAEVKLKKTEFTNEPFVDFSKPENRAAMEAALKKVAGEFGRDYPMFIGGEKVTTAEKIKSTNPSHPSQVIGVVQSASAEQARQAIESAHAYFDTWKKVPAEQRADACKQLLELERLDEIVVGPHVESLDALVHAVASGQHQDGDPVALVPEATGHREPVDPGHHHVEDDDVRRVALDRCECSAAVGRGFDLVTLVRKRPLEGLADGPVIVDDKDEHS